ncbi:hypothetical protein CJU90_4881 [Yarrowia sp. C11]|nr:hypothetical protein CJU90_4881 [Yarrowia sp. C11]KAG5364694.1 hypothetical protein CKK34_3512 [Yarrowia sp. E02]
MSEHIEGLETENQPENESYRLTQAAILALTALAKGVASVSFFREAFAVEKTNSSSLGWVLFWVSLISEFDRFAQSLRDNMYVISKTKFYSNETPESWQEQVFGQFVADALSNVSYVVYIVYVYRISTSWLLTFGSIQLVYVLAAGVAGAYFGIASKRDKEE